MTLARPVFVQESALVVARMALAQRRTPSSGPIVVGSARQAATAASIPAATRETRWIRRAPAKLRPWARLLRLAQRLPWKQRRRSARRPRVERLHPLALRHGLDNGKRSGPPASHARTG